MNDDLIRTKEQRLMELLQALDSVIIAYSGGVDSSLLAYYAHRVLGQSAQIVIAISPSLAQDELDAARAQAKDKQWNYLETATAETNRADYQRNDGGRCYICKSVLFETLGELAADSGVKNIAYGANVDDLADFRPGHRAAHEHHVLSPLQQANLTKEEIRFLAQQAGLNSWDRPQSACLASRFPTFEPVTIAGLKQVEASESFLRKLGFRQVRVRHYGQTAKVEVGADELDRFIQQPQIKTQITEALKDFGYTEVEIDPRGYRQGSANRLPTEALNG